MSLSNFPSFCSGNRVFTNSHPWCHSLKDLHIVIHFILYRHYFAWNIPYWSLGQYNSIIISFSNMWHRSSKMSPNTWPNDKCWCSYTHYVNTSVSRILYNGDPLTDLRWGLGGGALQLQWLPILHNQPIFFPQKGGRNPSPPSRGSAYDKWLPNHWLKQ